MDEVITLIEIIKSEDDEGLESFELWWSEDLEGTYHSERDAFKALFDLVCNNYNPEKILEGVD